MALYKLPPDDAYLNAELVEISFCLPCDEAILAAARGAIWGLALWVNWHRDSERRAAPLAAFIRELLECHYQEC
jgi:hypothetical protein